MIRSNNNNNNIKWAFNVIFNVMTADFSHTYTKISVISSNDINLKDKERLNCFTNK